MRLWLAGGFSILIHSAIFALPAGRFSFTEVRPLAGPPAQLLLLGKPAPLSVSLGTQTVRLASASRKPRSRTGGLAAAAPALDAAATQIPAHVDYKGNDEAFGVPLPLPLGLPSPEEYLVSRELSEHAEMLGEIPGLPDDPVEVPGAGILVITLWINESGLVDRTSIESSQLDSRTEQAVVSQFQRMRFSPAQRDGRAVKSRMKIQVEVLPPSSAPTGTSATEN